MASYDLEYVEEEEKKYFSFEDPVSDIDQDKQEELD